MRLIQKSHRHQNTRRLRSWHHLRPGAGCGKSSHGLVFSVAWLDAQWDNTMRTRASFPTHTGIPPPVLRLGTLGPSLTLRVVRRDVSSVEAPIRGLCELAVDLCLDKMITRTPSWISVLFLTQCRARGNEPLHPKVPNIFGKELLKTCCRLLPARRTPFRMSNVCSATVRQPCTRTPDNSRPPVTERPSVYPEMWD